MENLCTLQVINFEEILFMLSLPIQKNIGVES